MSCGCVTYQMSGNCQCGDCPVSVEPPLRGNGTLATPLGFAFDRINKDEALQLGDAICCSPEAVMTLRNCIMASINDCGGAPINPDNGLATCADLTKSSLTNNTDGSWTHSDGADPALETLIWLVSQNLDNLIVPGTDNGSYLTADMIVAAICATPSAQVALQACIDTTIDIIDATYDPATNSIIITESNGDVHPVPISEIIDVLVSADAGNDISSGSDGGAYLNICDRISALSDLGALDCGGVVVPPVADPFCQLALGLPGLGTPASFELYGRDTATNTCGKITLPADVVTSVEDNNDGTITYRDENNAATTLSISDMFCAATFPDFGALQCA